MTVSTPPRMTPYGSRWEPPAGLRKKVAVVAQAGFRVFGSATASLRSDPDYLVIGTKRGGTTSMARWLLDHPDVRPLYPAVERRKGAYYFDVNHHRGRRWYRSHFPVRAVHQRSARRSGAVPLIGDATPYYLYHPHAPARAKLHAPDARIIVLLRNPIDRAVGHWAERTRNGVESLSLHDALRAEPDRLAGEEQRMIDDPSYVSFAHQHWSYADQGRYVRGLRRWFDAFPTEQILVLRSEDMYTDPTSIYDQTLNFLGLAPHAPAAFAAWNMKEKEPVDETERAFLEQSLRDDVAELESFLGRSMQWEGFDS